jgi:methyl-accepting chemotaxis protein
MKEARRMERLNEANRASGDQQHEANSASTHIILIALLALGAGVSFSLFLARFTTVRISALTPFSDRMAEGDLTGRMDIDQKDEVGMLAFSLQKTQRNLGRIAELPLTRWSASPPSPTPCSMSPGNWPKARRT